MYFVVAAASNVTTKALNAEISWGTPHPTSWPAAKVAVTVPVLPEGAAEIVAVDASGYAFPIEKYDKIPFTLELTFLLTNITVGAFKVTFEEPVFFRPILPTTPLAAATDTSNLLTVEGMVTVFTTWLDLL